jgi:hypothetical protein
MHCCHWPVSLLLLLLPQVYLASVLLLCHRDSKDSGLVLVREGRQQYLVGAQSAVGCMMSM